MNTAQSAIVPDHCKSGIFIEADAQGSTDAIKQACVQSLDALADLQTQFPDASLGLMDPRRPGHREASRH